MAPAISHRALEALRDAFECRGVRYLFIGKSAALLHGFPDTTQDADLFVEKSAHNARAALSALADLGFDIDGSTARDIERGKDFVQLKNGPFDIDLVFAPDGIEHFADAWRRGVDIKGFPVCALEDVIASKRAANRLKDRESLRRLSAFRDYLHTRTTRHRRLGALTPAQAPTSPHEADALRHSAPTHEQRGAWRAALASNAFPRYEFQQNTQGLTLTVRGSEDAEEQVLGERLSVRELARIECDHRRWAPEAVETIEAFTKGEMSKTRGVTR